MTQLCFTLLPALVVLGLLQSGCGPNDTAELDESGGKATQQFLLGTAHYDTLSSNPRPLTGGAASIEELVRNALEAFGNKDTAGLRSLMITPDEFTTIILPELGKHWGSARDTRPAIRSMLAEMHLGGAEKGLRRAIRDLAGQRLTFESISFDKAEEHYPSYTMYESPTVTVRAGDRRLIELRALGSVVEKDGQFKFLSFRDRD